MKLTEEQIWKCNDAGDGSYHICVAHQNVVDFARAIEREIGFDNANHWLKRMEEAIKAEREECAKLAEQSHLKNMVGEVWAKRAAAAIRARGKK
jgi:hypothetical protein